MPTRAAWPAEHATLDAAQLRAAEARASTRLLAFAAERGLTDELPELIALLLPLAGYLAQRRARQPTPLRVGIAGAQGTGKSTIAALLAILLDAGLSLRPVQLSLDDLYLTRAERARLAREVHPLLATRGVPGTHDVALAQQLLAALSTASSGQRVRLPRFDKARDDRVPDPDFAEVEGPVDCILFEGWCVGARPEPDPALEPALNALERERDPDGRYRRYVNAQLAGPYRALFASIDSLIFLAAPDMASSLAWRIRQEHELAARRGGAAGVMDDAQIARFVQHYERISRHMLAELPARADVVVQLDRDHRFAAVSVR